MQLACSLFDSVRSVNGRGHVIIIDRFLAENRHAAKEADRATFAERECVETDRARAVFRAHHGIGNSATIGADNPNPADIAACYGTVGLDAHRVGLDVEAGEEVFRPGPFRWGLLA